ncbi:MAG: glycosyltransferase [Clostridia bacterium]|nr:glycosyltransferase [Clostridia bacterium]
MDFKYRISVIIPIYNVEEYLEACLESLVKQSIDKKDLEVLLINDGSPDNSEAICKKFCEKYEFFKYFSKENEGLSKTRNFGIQHAQGKYFVFLDPDDELTEKSLKNLADFFDKHENEVDIVTYKIVPVYNGKQSEGIHFRYKYLQYEGVYDLMRPENVYVTQTNVNICVKNKGKDNILFDTTENFRHEDQKYNIDIVRDKMKIGYCTGAKYLYTKNPGSITNTIFYAYYIFETTMAFWEELFNSFPDGVPQYFQAMYINDINWKTRSDILLPYHYEEAEFNKAVERICALLKKVDDSVISRHPKVDPPHKSYMLGLKYDNQLNVQAGCAGVSVLRENRPVFFENTVPLSICRFKADKEKVYIDAFLRSPILSFTDDVKMYAHLSGESDAKTILLETEISAWDYYHAKIKTNKFFRIRLDWDYKKYSAIYFSVDVGGESVPTRLEFIMNAPFATDVPRTSVFRCGYEFQRQQNGFVAFKASAGAEKAATKKFERTLMLKRPRTFGWRFLCANKVDPSRRIWLYYDCRNVYKDNGYYQFIHDFDMNDGVERYYVVNDDMDRKDLFTKKQRKNIIKFGSIKHRRFFLSSEKVITAFAEHENINPFPPFVWKYYTDLFKAQVVYLQHGVLHAFLPWKYSNDRLTAVDREVISTTFEVKNMSENYGFRDCDLIPAGMPRYDFIDIDAAKSEKKILFAPTWRKYLVDNDRGKLSANPAKFKNSNFFKETYEFLHSKELEKVLEENDWYLDFKLHPILASCAELYELNSKRIRVADKSVDEKSYKVFITDFSSFCFDFVYLKKTLMYFVPDDEMFRAGMNDYRKLDLPLEEGFGPLAHTSDEAVKYLIDLVKRNGEPDEIYAQRMDGFFLHADKNCRKRIYEAIK